MSAKLLAAERAYALATTDLIKKRAALRDAELEHALADDRHKKTRGEFLAAKEADLGLERDDDE